MNEKGEYIVIASFLCVTFFFVSDKFFHVNKQQLGKFKKSGKVRLSTIAHIRVYHAKALAHLLCKPCLANSLFDQYDLYAIYLHIFVVYSL